MKKINKITIMFVVIFITGFISSCEDGLTEMNINKVDPTSMNPYLEMNSSIINAWPDTQLWPVYHYAIVQQIFTPTGSSVQGANYNQISYGFNYDVIWNSYFTNSGKGVVDVVAKTKDNATRQNIYNAARIWKAYIFMVITDTYGDIPYFEAGKGYLEKVVFPKYDKQGDIYKDILKELDEASAALNASGYTSKEDIMYGGNIAQWKKFGYSLMLRAAMRLVKVDPTLAQTYVTKAVAGGLMQSNSDNAALRHSSLYINYNGYMFSGREYATFYMTRAFINHLKATNDPRLPVYAMRYVGALSGAQFTLDRLTSDPAKMIGMPLGYNDVTIATQFATDGVASRFDYSLANIRTVMQVSSPEYFVTYGQTQLLLAEAVYRGWVAGNAAAIFSNAIKANLQQLSEYGSTAVIDPAKIDAYVLANPLTPGNELKQINTEYWVASFLNGPELWANFRRSDLPALVPNPYPSSEVPGDFIHRLPYPTSEYVVNQANLSEANARQGSDVMLTRVWWDKK
jgi:hypothetical protein